MREITKLEEAGEKIDEDYHGNVLSPRMQSAFFPTSGRVPSSAAEGRLYCSNALLITTLSIT